MFASLFDYSLFCHEISLRSKKLCQEIAFLTNQAQVRKAKRAALKEASWLCSLFQIVISGIFLHTGTEEQAAFSDILEGKEGLKAIARCSMPF